MAGSKTNSNITVQTLSPFNPQEMFVKMVEVIAETIVNDAVTKVVKEVVRREKFPPASEKLQRLAEPSMKSYLNLYNNHRSVLRPEKVVRLEQKLADMQRYSQVIPDHLKVLIVDKINGITADQGNILQTKIMACLEAEVIKGKNDADQKFPKFLETSYNFKCLKVVCADDYSLAWLKETIAKLQPWPSARLEVTFMSTYSVYSTVSQKRTPKSSSNEGRLKFAVPNSSTTATGTTSSAPTKEVTFDDVRTHLELHNPPLKVATWKELYKHNKGTYTVYFVSMDLECIEEIKRKGNRLFYKLGTLRLAPLNQNDEFAYKKKLSDDRKKAVAEKLKAAGNTNP